MAKCDIVLHVGRPINLTGLGIHLMLFDLEENLFLKDSFSFSLQQKECINFTRSCLPIKLRQNFKQFSN